MQSVQRNRALLWGRAAALLVALSTTSASYAAGPGLASVIGGAGQDYAASVASDASGNTYVAGLTYSPDLPVTPGAFQTTIGGHGTLANPAGIASDAFIAKFGPDGTLLWCTFLGGSGDDYATGVAMDSTGNVLVTGWTRSVDFPVLHPLQPVLNSGITPYRWDAFVSKLDPAGSKLLYSTYLGGPNDDGAYGLAVDSAGNAYVTGQVEAAAGFTGFSSSANGFGMFVSKVSPQGTLVYSYFQPNVSFAGIAAAAAIAVDSAGSAYVAGTASSYYPGAPTYSFGPQGSYQAIVFKLSPDGAKVVYETTLGGSVASYGMAIGVDSTGSAYVGGITTSVDFPLVHPIQSNLGARPLWKSTDGGATWSPQDNLPFAYPQALVVDPSAPKTLYAATRDVGVFKSLDGGVTWSSANKGITNVVQVLAIDPLHPQTLYAASGSGATSGNPYVTVTPGVVYKSVDGGNNWAVVDSAASSQAVQIALDPQNPSILYVVWSGVVRKSIDGGASWASVVFPGTLITSLALDPHVSGLVYAYSEAIAMRPPAVSIPPFVYTSSDGGATWVKLTTPPLGTPSVWTVDGSTNPSAVFNGLNYRTTDNGATWTTLPASSVVTGNTTAVAVDSSGTLYAATYNVGTFTSHDHGQTWTAIGSIVPPSPYYGFLANVLSIVPIGATGTLYAIVDNQQSSGFVTRLSPDGSNIVFSTLLNGHFSLAAWITYGAQPGVFATQNWVSGIAFDPAGNVIVAGGTRASDFPMANAKQSANAGRADAFVATLAPDGSKLNYSTFFGGSQDDSALAVAADPQGNLILAGQTWSNDIPIPGAAQRPAFSYGDAFVVKLTPPAPPLVTAVVNGASFQPGIEAGSWVMIQGANLANTNPGRTWAGSDFDGPNLPTALDGVSVTIDGKPAFVEYVSPTQLNVQAPSDSVAGAVNVVVDNNGALSAPFAVALQAVAPAFFLDGGSNYAVASRIPGYAVVGNSSAPVTPGDTVVLWGTGFGPTNPNVPAGAAVTGAPATVTAPTVTVGGMSVPVVSTVLTDGSVGLYQLTVQLPANLPTGALPVLASIGGVQTPAGVLLFVANQ